MRRRRLVEAQASAKCSFRERWMVEEGRQTMNDSLSIAACDNNIAFRYEPTGAAAVLEVVEPRCRICRDPQVRRLANHLLDERRLLNAVITTRSASTATSGVPKKITFASILAQLEPINEGRPKGDRIIYTSLWNHARRHDSTEGRAAYWAARVSKELRRALGGQKRELQDT